jgi:hypothetical protein
MFWSTIHSLRIWWEDFSDDILGADLPPSTDPVDEISYHLEHPHRRRLESIRERRDGAVVARPGVCLSPVGRPAPRYTGSHQHRSVDQLN